jgi:sugar lactone lactonase YvrE
MLSDPESLLFDGAGNLYIGDPDANRIRMIDASGVITSFAGTGERGYEGDGGPAIEATLHLDGNPASLAIDASGNVYIGDSGNHVIRVVDPSGTISTLKVTASSAAATGLLPTACPTPLASGSIATVAGSGTPGKAGDGGPALEAELSLTLGSLAVDADGDLYIADWYSPTIRKVDTEGIITTFAGPTTGAPFGSIGGLAFDAAGDLFVSDWSASKVWRVDPSGDITTAAGTGVLGASGDDGPAIEAQIRADNIGVSPSGQIYLNDTNLYRTVTTDGLIHAFAGTGETGFSGDGGPALEATFGEVIGVTPDRAGNVYVADTGNQRIRRVDLNGIITTVAGNGKGVSDPVMIAVDERDGSVYYTEHHGHRVQRVAADGTISTVAGTGEPGFSGDCGPATEAMLDRPWGIAIHNGVLFIADMGNGRVRMVVP